MLLVAPKIDDQIPINILWDQTFIHQSRNLFFYLSILWKNLEKSRTGKKTSEWFVMKNLNQKHDIVIDKVPHREFDN